MALTSALDASFLAMVLAGTTPAPGPAVYEVLAAPDALTRAPFTVGGLVRGPGHATDVVTYQTPGTYFETAFKGDRLYLKVGPGNATLRVSVGGQALPVLVRPTPGYYELSDLAPGRHRVRVEVAASRETKTGEFDGFYILPEERPLK